MTNQPEPFIDRADSHRPTGACRSWHTLGVMIQLAKSVATILICASAFAGAACAADPEADHWLPIRRLIGDWSGTVTGEPGLGVVTRRYAFVMNDRFVQETNTSRYPRQEQNKSGEVHEHWGFFSYDKMRKLLILRQFHVEGFVNTYRHAGTTGDPDSLVFESEVFENFSNAWKARETYRFLSDDEFVETFELAAPAKPYQVYSRSHFRRRPK